MTSKELNLESNFVGYVSYGDIAFFAFGFMGRPS